jgi:hypothetical protein
MIKHHAGRVETSAHVLQSQPGPAGYIALGDDLAVDIESNAPRDEDETPAADRLGING